MSNLIQRIITIFEMQEIDCKDHLDCQAIGVLSKYFYGNQVVKGDENVLNLYSSLGYVQQEFKTRTPIPYFFAKLTPLGKTAIHEGKVKRTPVLRVLNDLCGWY
ncbi:MAG: hypothetical protein PHF86_11110 [Candidatus Nanoarchaeia archaeon]|nr:hypothetical protein [Candidatus Nanoarchaeia archaeon]